MLRRSLISVTSPLCRLGVGRLAVDKTRSPVVSDKESLIYKKDSNVILYDAQTDNTSIVVDNSTLVSSYYSTAKAKPHRHIQWYHSESVHANVIF